MKSLLLILCFISFNAFSATLISKDDKSVQFIQNATLLSVETKIPKNIPHGPLFEPFGQAKIQISTSSCANRFGDIATDVKYNFDSKKYVITIAAMELINKSAPKIRCNRANTIIVEVNLGLGFFHQDDFVLKVLK